MIRKQYQNAAKIVQLLWIRTVLVVVGLASIQVCEIEAATVGDAAAERSSEALKHYNEGRFQEAVEQYRQAQIEDPLSQEIQFNVGDALYKVGDFETAARIFEEVTSNRSSDLSARSYYNLGNSLFQKQAYPEAVEAYKQSLSRGFEDDVVSSNLELALRMQQQQQEQKQQQQQQQEDEEKSDSSENTKSEQETSSDSQDDNEEARKEQGQQEQKNSNQTEEQSEESTWDSSSTQPTPEEPGIPEEQESVPGQMSREEAEQLLGALDDDERETQRRRFSAKGRSQRKDW